VPRERIQRALGSGFLISQAGDILKNNHVVAGSEAIEVSLFGDETKTYRAVTAGRDPPTDSALIEIQETPSNLRAATLGDSSALEPPRSRKTRPGRWVCRLKTA
jgi:S1-C subfamily serine protease